MTKESTRSFKKLHNAAIRTETSLTEKLTAEVKFNKLGLFTFNRFALFQFIAGMNINATKSPTTDEYNILLKLATYSIAYDEETASSMNVELSREEVTILKYMLEARINHCEIEKDQDDEKFNPETYVNMKLMLIDLREWLAVQLITE